jgi:hypothetical protein
MRTIWSKVKYLISRKLNIEIFMAIYVWFDGIIDYLIFFFHFMNSNLHVFVRCIVNFLPSQSDSQIHVNLNS